MIMFKINQAKSCLRAALERGTMSSVDDIKLDARVTNPLYTVADSDGRAPIRCTSPQIYRQKNAPLTPK